MTHQNDQIREIRKNVEEIYHKAMEKESLGVALKAKELLGKEYGLFKFKEVSKGIVQRLSDQDLTRLISLIEKQLRLDHESKSNVHTKTV